MNRANCQKLVCLVGGRKKPLNCPMIEYPEVYEEARDLYKESQNKLMARSAGIVEATGYIEWPRLKDTIEYAKLMQYQNLGIAFCIGLLEEARKLQQLLESYGFNVSSSLCKTGGSLGVF